MGDKEIIEPNRQNSNLRKYVLTMFGLIALCVFTYLLTSGPLYHYFLWDEHTSLPYLFGIVIALHAIYLSIVFAASTVTTAILLKKGKRHSTVILTMFGFVAGYNLVPWLGYYSETRMDFVLSLKVHILYVAVPTLLFVHLQLIVYAFLFRERSKEKQAS
jgi:hypothetical protein